MERMEGGERERLRRSCPCQSVDSVMEKLIWVYAHQPNFSYKNLGLDPNPLFCFCNMSSFSGKWCPVAELTPPALGSSAYCKLLSRKHLTLEDCVLKVSASWMLSLAETEKRVRCKHWATRQWYTWNMFHQRRDYAILFWVTGSMSGFHFIRKSMYSFFLKVFW